MIKIDLITGFLGSGKTTFIKKYASYLLKKGMNIGILENDFGAVNVDMMLLKELEGENCELEMIAGGCDRETHRRRFKTKLIAMGMCGYDRVIVEPSGIFDVDEFFDALYEEPLDRWYEIGNVITIVDAGLEETLSRSGNERNRVKYDFIHHTHTQQPVDVVRLFRSDFCQIADVCCGFPPFVKHRYGIIRCDMIKGVFPYLIDAAIFKAQFLIRFAT